MGENNLEENDVTLSLIIALFQPEDYLQRIEKLIVANQKHLYEVILIEDGVHDKSLVTRSQIVANRLNNAGIRVLYRQHNQCDPNATYNLGIQISSGQMLMILDQDDEPLGSFFSVIGSLKNGDGGSKLVATSFTTNVRAVNIVCRILQLAFVCFLSLRATFTGHSLNNRVVPQKIQILGWFSTRSGIIYPSATAKTTRFPEPSFPGSDIDHLKLLRKKHEMIYVHKARVLYRLHPSALSTRRALENQERGTSTLSEERIRRLFSKIVRKRIL